MKNAWKTAVMATMTSVVLGACAAGAYSQTSGQAADNLPPKFIRYYLYQHPMFDPGYSIAWKVMEPIYKGTEYERRPETPTDVPTNPYIQIGEFDLNGDKVPEIIAYPQETTDEDNVLCKEEIVCPFYILQVRDKIVYTLGVINAVMVDRGNDVVNGYWTLHVYTADKSVPDYKTPKTYIYDRNKDGYVPAPAQTVATPPRASGP